jgi:hypothetical protein
MIKQILIENRRVLAVATLFVIMGVWELVNLKPWTKAVLPIQIAVLSAMFLGGPTLKASKISWKWHYVPGFLVLAGLEWSVGHTQIARLLGGMVVVLMASSFIGWLYTSNEKSSISG